VGLPDFGYLEMNSNGIRSTMFITFEGLDRSGKTTQAKLLVGRLKDMHREVLFLREPGGTHLSEKIRDILLDKGHSEMSQTAELFLFSAARSQLVRQIITPALASGVIVICDRFADSTTAYQGYGRSLPLEDVRAINRIAIAGTTPDITVLVDIEPDESFRRQEAAGTVADRMESAGKDFFNAVRSGYLSLSRAEPQRIVVVDGMRPVHVIHEEIWSRIQPRLP
jgi:dTMP kinase